MDLSKYNQLEQLSSEQLDYLENSILDVIGDSYNVEQIYIVGSFVFGFDKIKDIDVAVMIPESEGYCRLNELSGDRTHYYMFEQILSGLATRKLGVKISMTPFNHDDFLTDSVKRVYPPMYNLTKRFWINKQPGDTWNYYMIRQDDYVWKVERDSEEGKRLTQMKYGYDNEWVLTDKLEWIINENGVTKVVKHDQFYSTNKTVDEIMSVFNSTMDEIGFDTTEYTFIEPSAGDGIILERLPKERRIGIDIDPKHDEIIHCDFLDWYPSVWKKYITIGNPPFGVRGSKVEEFVKHAAKFSDVIALGAPEYFEMQVEGMQLIYNKKLTDDKYRLVDETEVEIPVGINFQIWVKLEHYPNMTN